jgi:dTMP kinase
VREGFLALAAAEPQRFAVIDASRAADDVTRDVIAALDRVSVRPSTPSEPKPASSRMTR